MSWLPHVRPVSAGRAYDASQSPWIVAKGLFCHSACCPASSQVKSSQISFIADDKRKTGGLSWHSRDWDLLHDGGIKI